VPNQNVSFPPNSYPSRFEIMMRTSNKDKRLNFIRNVTGNFALPKYIDVNIVTLDYYDKNSTKFSYHTCFNKIDVRIKALKFFLPKNPENPDPKEVKDLKNEILYYLFADHSVDLSNL
jgi:hypothetical protein